MVIVRQSERDKCKCSIWCLGDRMSAALAAASSEREKCNSTIWSLSDRMSAALAADFERTRSVMKPSDGDKGTNIMMFEEESNRWTETEDPLGARDAMYGSARS